MIVKILFYLFISGISLIFVAILGLIVLYIYAVVSFAFLHNFFTASTNAELYCGNLIECMYSILRFGLLDNIGLVSIIIHVFWFLYESTCIALSYR